MPKIEWMGSPNFWVGRAHNSKVIAIVDHIMDDASIANVHDWFQNTRVGDKRVSAHFGVAKDGRIWQWVHTEDTAWANGVDNLPDTTIGWIADKVVKQGVNPNTLTVSIEHEGKPGDAVTQAQYEATVWLHKLLIAKYGIPVDRDHIIGHYQINSIDKADCPKWSKDFWLKLLPDLKAPINHISNEVPKEFGPGTVILDGAWVRAAPSFGDDGVVLRTLPIGTVLSFVGLITDGPAFQGGTTWYQISPADGDGWIHSKEIG